MEENEKLVLAMKLLERADKAFTDQKDPDEKWYRDYFLLTGDHMVLTDGGWTTVDKAHGEKIFDEVNAGFNVAKVYEAMEDDWTGRIGSAARPNQ